MPLSKSIAANLPLADLRQTPRRTLSARSNPLTPTATPPKPSVISPEPSVISPKPSVISPKPSVILSEATRSLTASRAAEGPRDRPHPRNRSNLSAPKTRFCLAKILALVLALLSLTTTAHARTPDPPQRIPLTPLGFQNISDRYLLEGATMLTVDFVDNTHLLVTFGISRLMPRLPDCPADDEDRTVKAVLLELPSGRELAATEWRFHDLGQYLWNLGDGHFMLRNRDTLATFAPLQNLAVNPSANPFAQQAFLKFSRRIEVVIVSPDHDLMIVETAKPKVHVAMDPMLQISAQQPAAPASPTSPSSPPPSPGLHRRDPNDPVPGTRSIELNFLRILHLDAAQVATLESKAKRNPAETRALLDAPAPTGPTRVVAALEARVRTENVVNFPLTTEGYLDTRAETRDGVLFHFVTYAGADLDLGDFATSCHPRPTFISHSEFVTYGCRGADDALDLAGFNLRGDLIWQINFTDLQAYPSFASAPAAGRFAFSRTITTSNVFGSETPSMSQLTAQEIRVVQMYNGKQLLRAVASPIQRAGQNYALAPDGLTLAVIHDLPALRDGKTVHDPAVELFKLPAFTPKDLAEMKTEAAMAPPPSNAPMRFSLKEIKESLNPKPSAPGSTDADSSIVGDPIETTPAAAPSALSQSPAGRIVGDTPAPTPSSVAPNSSSPASNPSASAPATPVPAAQPAQSDSSDPDSPQPEKRRKPPTLYEPAPANTPADPSATPPKDPQP